MPTPARLLLAALVVPVAACTTPPPGERVASALSRSTIAAPAADVAAVVGAGTDLGFQLYRQARDGSPNLALSPLSITTALNLASAGARGTTAQAFQGLLGPGLPDERRHPAEGTLLARLDEPAVGLRVANQVFAQRGLALQAPFLDTLATAYGADVRLVDFIGNGEGTRQAIDAWVASATDGLIPELLQPGDLTADTRLELVNAVVFEGDWETRFEPNSVAGTFHLADGGTSSATMMGQKQVLVRMAEVEGTLALELPYRGGRAAMLLLVPAQGQLRALEDSLDQARLATVVGALQADRVALKLPRFSIKATLHLSEALSALGLGVAFGPQADFTGISTTEAPQLESVVHQAVVRVDEQGTVAVAATAVGAATTSLPQYVVIDRPFLFAIRDTDTGALLFLGRLEDPAR